MGRRRDEGCTKEKEGGLVMQTIQIKLPEFVNINEREIIFILASKLYEDGRLSSGQAAELAGVSKRTFLELIGKYNVSVFNYDAEEIVKDLANA